MADNELFYAVPEITDSFERVHSEMWDMSFELPSVGFVPEPYENAGQANFSRKGQALREDGREQAPAIQKLCIK